MAILLSVICSTWLALLFKLFGNYKVQTFQAIVVNYIVCVICGSILDGTLPSTSVVSTSWFPVAAILGVLFISGFFAIGMTVKYFGVTVGSVVSKMSIALSVTAAFFLFGEQATALKILGILIAIAAVFLVSKKDEKITFNKNLLLIPAYVFLCSGIIEILINYAQLSLLQESEFNLFNISLFGIAGLIGFVILAGGLISGKLSFTLRDLIGGILLGIPNYFSIYFLLKALAMPDWNSSMVYPIVNVSIISLSALLAWMFLNEKISRLNTIGIGLSLLAIFLITYGA